MIGVATWHFYSIVFCFLKSPVVIYNIVSMTHSWLMTYSVERNSIKHIEDFHLSTVVPQSHLLSVQKWADGSGPE